MQNGERPKSVIKGNNNRKRVTDDERGAGKAKKKSVNYRLSNIENENTINHRIKNEQMKNFAFFLTLFCVFAISVANTPAFSTNQNDMISIRGRILAADSGKPLFNASISVENSNVAVVSNQDGYFSLRIDASLQNSSLIVRFLGYENRKIPIKELTGKPDTQILLSPSAIQLSEIQVLSGDGTELVRKALSRIPSNYPQEPNMMVAFYRESIKKNGNYISLVEAVLDIYKASYKSYEEDQAKIYIGRKATNISARDTVLMKFQGGISTALLLDVAKKDEIVFGEDGSEYLFTIQGVLNINNKQHYVVAFEPRPEVKEIVFRGTIYIDAQSFAIARMEFNMNVENRKDAAALFIRKKPAKMRVMVEKAHYFVDFIEKDGKWYFNYSSTNLDLRVRWMNRFFGLFATNYSVQSEIAITDRYTDKAAKFPRNERIRSTDVIAEKVEYFTDVNFWGDYNVIEPNLEISKAIKKLSDKLKRRAE